MVLKVTNKQIIQEQFRPYSTDHVRVPDAMVYRVYPQVGTMKSITDKLQWRWIQ